jgi:hypothetical protein
MIVEIVISINLVGGLLKSTMEQLDGGKAKKNKAPTPATTSEADVATPTGPVKIFLNFKKFVFSNDKKKIAQ